MLKLHNWLTPCSKIAHGKGSVKADQWCNQISVLFIAVFVAWEVDDEIPEINAPLSAPGTKNAAVQETMEKLLHRHLLQNLLFCKLDASADEIMQSAKWIGHSTDTMKLF